MTGTFIRTEALPSCVYRTVFGNCMAFPGVWCSTVMAEGKCVKKEGEKDGR